jgi:L-ascorbate metabolism protein UlaG (beta-lactamase superfamily)
MSRFWLNVILAASVTALLTLPATAAPLTVTALDHSGFMFSDGKTKILADALLEPSEWPYHAPSADLLGKMEKGDKPFDGVTLMFISHDHEDHYSAPSTVRFLQNHPKTLVVTTPEVLKRLKTIPGFDKVEAQVIAPDIAWKKSLTKTFNGVTVELDRIRHGDNGKWACEVDALVFTLGGKRVLYAVATDGHFPEEYSELGYAKRGFDLAFVNYGMAIKGSKGETPASLKPEGIAMIKNLIGAKTTVLMHMEGTRAAEVEKMLPELQQQLPGVTVFSAEMESRTF